MSSRISDFQLVTSTTHFASDEARTRSVITTALVHVRVTIWF